jgi:hypothetical protein
MINHFIDSSCIVDRTHAKINNIELGNVRSIDEQMMYFVLYANGVNPSLIINPQSETKAIAISLLHRKKKSGARLLTSSRSRLMNKCFLIPKQSSSCLL